ncbi:MAG: hypothetical protein IT372_26120 [Polyangiaceae bacterium]|nr:hypothetical protein [Polyangiaceae bacterium]
MERSDAISRLTRHSWIAGVGGMVTLLALGCLAHERGALEGGWGLISSGGPASKPLSIAFALLVATAVMFAIELIVRVRVEGGELISVADEIQERRYWPFLRRCLAVYLADLLLIALFLAFYRAAGEYGFRRARPGYYQPWLAVMDHVFTIYLWGGLPYVLLTRALQHDPKADRKQAAFTVFKAARRLGALLARLTGREGPAEPEAFDEHDRTAVLGLLVKAFYVPLMTVFFTEQFSGLVKNYGFVLDVTGPDGRRPTIREMYDVALSIIFSVDVGLAWAGYVASSRWVKTTMYSVEPTVLGWAVALLCYPPFNRIQGAYFTTPGEHAFLELSSRPAISLLASFSVASFAFYTAATVAFGLHFSNLTHRGIITTGPYSIVRHPAYAAKNFAWWCVMFPYAVADAISKESPGQLAMSTLGLLAMSGLYYLRAITEERHLGKDPEYRDYMKRVPYRFIPGFI